MRGHIACYRCRERKHRCIVLDHGRACTNCMKKGETCSAAKPPLGINRILARHGAPSSSPAQGNDNSPENLGLPPSVDARGALPAKELCDELVDLYFDLMHDKQHALFHRPSFVKLQQSGQAPLFIVLAMIAMVARFSKDPFFGNTEPFERGREWAERSRKLFNDRDSAVSLIAVQGCALLANLAYIQGDSAMESLYGVQQIRMVQLLGLPRKLSSDLIQREVEIRVWWTTWMMDTWTSTSVGVSKQLEYRPEYPRPMEEEEFENLGSNIDQHHDDTSDAGLWSQMVPLTEILARVSELNDSTARHLIPQTEIFDQVRDLGSRLGHWLLCLPQQLQLNSDNLETHRKKGFGRILVALHLGYHHHSLQLYFQFLSFHVNYAKDRLLVDIYARRCKMHASELSKLMWTANTTLGLECLWSINGHLLVVASAVHLHSLLFEEDETQVSAAKQMLAQNFELLLQLQKFWPSLERSMSRLRTFHSACQESTHSAFDMNQWMMHFLQKYALPVEDQDTGSSPMVHPVFEDNWSASSLPLDATANDILQIFL